MKKLIFSLLLFSTLVGCKTDDSTVTPVITKSNKNDITAFEIISPKVAGIINNDQITIQMPYGSDVSQLKSSITIPDKAIVSPASGEVADFTNPVSYTVTAEDGGKKVYVVTIQFENRLLFYNAINGASLVTDTKTMATVSSTTLATNWSEITRLGASQALFYDSKTGKATTTDNKNFGKINDYSIESDLYNINYLGLNTVLLLSKSNNASNFKDINLQKKSLFPNIGGESVVSSPLGSNKATYLFYNPTTGLSAHIDIKLLGPLSTGIDLGKNWTHLIDVGNGSLLAYNSANGASALLQNEKPFAKNKDLSSFAAGYTHIIDAGIGQVLFYNAKTGEGMLTDNKTFTKIANANIPTSPSGKWTHVAVL